MHPTAGEQAFRDRIVERFASLPPQQRAVAEWFLDHLAEVPFLSVPELARRAGASDATVVRFCQSLGYDGFGGLKGDLLEVHRTRLRDGSRLGAGPTGDDDDTLAAVGRQEVGNIERSIADLDRAAFRAAASALFRADHVYAFGLGISSHLAGMLVYLLTQIGLRATVLPTGSSSPLEAAVVLRPTDLLVAFSFPPYSRQTVALVESAAGRGVATLAISDRRTAPAATVSRHALAVRSDNMMFTNSFGAVSALLNALVTEIAVRNREHAVEAVGRISRILDDAPDLIGGGS